MTVQSASPSLRRATRKTELVGKVCDYIRENSSSRLTLVDLGARFGLSPFHLQRTFTEVMGISPRRYVEECRLARMRSSLSKGDPVVGALRRSGYSSQSWLYGDYLRKLGMTPATYRKGGEGATISYATGGSSLGSLLVAATRHGVCSVKAGGSEEGLVRALRKEFPKARFTRGGKAVAFFEALADHLGGQDFRFPVEVAGTDFQLRVWAALRTIPLGQTVSYSEVAAMVGEPRAVRAVANACGSNPVPLVVPCHRVIQKDGGLGGYGMGIGRKKALLLKEGAHYKRE